jgi:hypothetical protein
MLVNVGIGSSAGVREGEPLQNKTKSERRHAPEWDLERG